MGKPPNTSEQEARAADLRLLNLQLDRSGESLYLAQLVQQMAQGDDDAFAGLYDETSARVFGTVLRVLRSSDLAREVTQEVYVEIWRKAAAYDQRKGSVLAWITTIARRRAVDRVRAVSSETVRDDRYAASGAGPDFDQVWEAVENRMETARVRKALANLSDIHREAVTLAYLGGYSQSEVAQVLQVPLGTVKTRIRAGLAGLRDALRMLT